MICLNILDKFIWKSIIKGEIMKKVLVDRPLHREAFELLSKNVEVIEIYDDASIKIEEALKVVDGVICSAALKMREHQISIAENTEGT